MTCCIAWFTSHTFIDCWSTTSLQEPCTNPECQTEASHRYAVCVVYSSLFLHHYMLTICSYRPTCPQGSVGVCVKCGTTITQLDAQGHCIHCQVAADNSTTHCSICGKVRCCGWEGCVSRGGLININHKSLHQSCDSLRHTHTPCVHLVCTLHLKLSFTMYTTLYRNHRVSHSTPAPPPCCHVQHAHATHTSSVTQRPPRLHRPGSMCTCNLHFSVHIVAWHSLHNLITNQMGNLVCCEWMWMVCISTWCAC